MTFPKQICSFDDCGNPALDQNWKHETENKATRDCHSRIHVYVKVYCTTVYVSSATVENDAQSVEQCECDSATVVCPVEERA